MQLIEIIIERQDLAAWVAALGAFASACWAFYSWRSTREMLRIARAERDAKDGAVDGYLSDIFGLQASTGNYIAAGLMYTNRSENPDSIVRVELVMYYSASNVRTNIVVQPTLVIPTNPLFSNITFAVPPKALAARGAASLWICFRIPDLLSEEDHIERYVFEATMSSGTLVSVQSNIAGPLHVSE